MFFAASSVFINDPKEKKEKPELLNKKRKLTWFNVLYAYTHKPLRNQKGICKLSHCANVYYTALHTTSKKCEIQKSDFRSPNI